MSIDYDLFVIDSNNQATEEFQLRDCIHDAIEELDKRIKKLEILLDKTEGEIRKEKEAKKWIPKDGKVCEGAGIVLASGDYWEMVDGKRKEHFTWDECKAIEEKVGNGWRMMTPQEATLICAEFGFDSDGIFDASILEETTGIGRKGWVDDDGDLRDVFEGNYWESRVYSGTSPYYLCFRSSSLDPQGNSSKGNGFSLRLVKDLKG